MKNGHICDCACDCESHENTINPIKGIELTHKLLEGTGISRTHMHMMALPRMIPCGYGKEWTEGSIDDCEILDRFEAEYSHV